MPKKKEIGVMNKRYLISQQEDRKFIENINENIRSDVIIITRDKLENILLKAYNSRVKKPDGKSPLSIFITTVLSVLTADFKDFLISKEVWQVIFFVMMIISGIWSLVNFIRAKNKSRDVSIENLINKIANVEKDGGG